MLDVVLALLPKVGSVVAALPEFAKLIATIGSNLSEKDQAVLQNAYQLAKRDSDEANEELAALIAERLA